MSWNLFFTIYILKRLFLCETACEGKHDLTLVLDASSAAGEKGFAKMKKFAKDFIDGFDIGERFTHVALVTFGGTASVDLSLNSRANKERVKQQIDALTYKGGPSSPSSALNVANNNVFTASNGMRDQTFNRVSCDGVILRNPYIQRLIVGVVRATCKH